MLSNLPTNNPFCPVVPQIDFGSIQLPGGSNAGAGAGRPAQQGGLDDPTTVRQMFLSNPHQLALLKERNPNLADALISGDVGGFYCCVLQSVGGTHRILVLWWWWWGWVCFCLLLCVCVSMKMECDYLYCWIKNGDMCKNLTKNWWAPEI